MQSWLLCKWQLLLEVSSFKLWGSIQCLCIFYFFSNADKCSFSSSFFMIFMINIYFF